MLIGLVDAFETVFAFVPLPGRFLFDFVFGAFPWREASNLEVKFPLAHSHFGFAHWNPAARQGMQLGFEFSNECFEGVRIGLGRGLLF